MFPLPPPLRHNRESILLGTHPDVFTISHPSIFGGGLTLTMEHATNKAPIFTPLQQPTLFVIKKSATVQRCKSNSLTFLLSSSFSSPLSSNQGGRAAFERKYFLFLYLSPTHTLLRSLDPLQNVNSGLELDAEKGVGSLDLKP
jgi:hypothetical protein